MVRPKKERGVTQPPEIQSFKPAGIPMKFLERVVLTLDEFEAVRLADYEGLDHKDAAEKMNISRPTFSRLIEKARCKISEVLIEVKELFIEGGKVHFRNNLFKCGKCGEVINLSIDSEGPQKCPECGNLNVINMAEQFGHGPCCPPVRRGRRKGRGGRGKQQ